MVLIVLYSLIWDGWYSSSSVYSLQSYCRVCPSHERGTHIIVCYNEMCTDGNRSYWISPVILQRYCTERMRLSITQLLVSLSSAVTKGTLTERRVMRCTADLHIWVRIPALPVSVGCFIWAYTCPSISCWSCYVLYCDDIQSLPIQCCDGLL